ncbi:MAG: DUF1788 domain-containing protein, partial [Deltaproteobacteria bacterium]|nr:DUF1788 domain-containing protein [Deltaproteobacteria bacterium]
MSVENKIKKLADSYGSYIAIPWRPDAAPLQRVIFCVYSEHDELRLRARLGEFEIATKNAGHNWMQFDLTDTFADWLSNQRYSDKYFRQPGLLTTLLPKYLEYLVQKFNDFLTEQGADGNTVVSLIGAGSLFGLLKVKEVVERFAPLVSGRLLV